MYSLISCWKATSHVACTQVRKQTIASTPRASPIPSLPSFLLEVTAILTFMMIISLLSFVVFTAYLPPKWNNLVLPVFELYIKGIILHFGVSCLFCSILCFNDSPCCWEACLHWFILIHNTPLHLSFFLRVIFSMAALWILFMGSLKEFGVFFF